MTSPAPDVPTLPLNDGSAIPQLGFGVYRIDPEGTADAVARALAAGYRHVDTARAYRNEAGVGRAVRDLVYDGLRRRRSLGNAASLIDCLPEYARALLRTEHAQYVFRIFV